MKARLLTGLCCLVGLAAAADYGYNRAQEETCAICGERLPSSVYLVTDAIAGDKKKVCGGCTTITQVCYLCGLPVKRDLTELSDGRILCARDAKSVVLDEAEVRRVCQETRDTLDRQFSRFISFPETNLTIAMADRVSLLEFFKTPGEDYECPNVMGYIQTRTNQNRLQHRISLMSGLQPGVLRATCAHEITHAWIAENVSAERKARLGRDAGEGFCELVAYLVLGALGDTDTQKVVTKNAYTRGQAGLFIEAEQRFGFNEVVDWMRHGEDAQLVAGQVERVRLTVPTVTPTEPRTAKTVSAQPAPLRRTTDRLVLQGITFAGTRSLAAINDRNFSAGEEAKVSVSGTNVSVRCLEIRADSVLIQVAGSEAKQELRIVPGASR